MNEEDLGVEAIKINELYSCPLCTKTYTTQNWKQMEKGA
jgi:RNA polymerase subunit RPABC4/transcription elongation factor Spt4